MLKYVALASALLFSGCFTPYTQSPIAVNFKKSEQNKLQAAAHWQIVADDLAKSLTKYKGKSIYIEKPSKTTAFDRAFYKMILSSVVARGIDVSTKKEYADAVMKFDTQSVYFTRKLTKPKRVGVLASLGSGVFLLRNANAGQIAAASVVAIEGFNYYNSKFDSIPHTELIVHIDIFDDKRYLDSLTKVYYIVDRDIRLYKEHKKKVVKPKPSPLIELEG